MENPLLLRNHTNSTHLRFDLFQTEHFPPAFSVALAKAKENLARLAAEKAAPTFANTIEALEDFREDLDRVSNVFFNLNSAATSDAMQAIAKEISPQLADFSNDILLNESLFSRIKAIYAQKKSLSLSPEQSELLEKTYKNFSRNGANCTPAQKEKLREIDRELAEIGQKFSENILKSTNEYQLVITDAKRLTGLPDAVMQAAAETAIEKNLTNSWVFTLQAPSYLPVMQYAQDEKLREEISLAYACRATKGEFNNRPLALKLAALRAERAQLLGFATHADYVLAERMASTPAIVTQFLHNFLQKAKPRAEIDVADIRARKAKESSVELHSWDFAYYSEKLKHERYNFAEEQLRPYFPLSAVINGVFTIAQKLYGLSFHERKDIPVYHPDVSAYEVKDKDGSYIGLFYADFYPRESKQGGAWMTLFREQGTIAGKEVRPHVSIVCNFRKPTATQPSLLSIDEVRTLFHEFGHALHGLLSACRYTSLSGVNVYWDFVELPSQIMENWVLEPEALSLFARHYENGETLPQEWIDKIKQAAQFQAGYQTIRQLSFALLDMAWHTLKDTNFDPDIFERTAMQDTLFFPPRPGSNVSCGFSHIFSGGYSAGYYSYKWAEVLDADAFEYFREKGILNPAVGMKFREHILARGGSAHPAELYRNFRGRDPNPDALLRRDGLL